MSADKQHKHAAFVRFDERLQRFHKHHPILFSIATIVLGLALFGVVELIEWMFQVRK